MLDDGLALVGGPTDGQHVEAGGAIQQVVLLQEVQGQLRQAALFGTAKNAVCIILATCANIRIMRVEPTLPVVPAA